MQPQQLLATLLTVNFEQGTLIAVTLGVIASVFGLNKSKRLRDSIATGAFSAGLGLMGPALLEKVVPVIPHELAALALASLGPEIFTWLKRSVPKFLNKKAGFDE